jgi:hypothetical protein
MTVKFFRGRIDAYAPYNAYNGHPPVPPRPIAITEGQNVENWKVDSQGVIFNYKIIHNLNLSDPTKLVFRILYIYSFSTSDPVIARIFPGDANHFVVQTYGVRSEGPSPLFEVPASFVFEAQLYC